MFLKCKRCTTETEFADVFVLFWAKNLRQVIYMVKNACHDCKHKYKKRKNVWWNENLSECKMQNNSWNEVWCHANFGDKKLLKISNSTSTFIVNYSCCCCCCMWLLFLFKSALHHTFNWRSTLRYSVQMCNIMNSDQTDNSVMYIRMYVCIRLNEHDTAMST